MIENRSLSGTYRHNLDINIQTSSGDKINLSFNNQKSLDMNLSNKDENNELGFSSLQSFSFSYDGDGIDEKDKKDEATALYDINLDKNNSISEGILLDDELEYLLAQIQSKKILIFDKCHSGSSHRGYNPFIKAVEGEYKLSPKF